MREFYNSCAEDYAIKEFSYDNLAVLVPFEKLLPRNSYILEIGGGAGRDATWMVSQGHRVLALDISEKLLQKIQKIRGVEVIHKDMREIDWENKFDGVMSVASIMHISKKEGRDVFARIAKSLKPGGLFFVTVPVGDDEGIDAKGRYFANYEISEIVAMGKAIGLLPAIEPWCNLNKNQRQFLNAIFKK